MKISAKASPKYVVGLLALLWSVCFISDIAFRHPDGRIFFWLFDDALISMRYAWNWAHGNGLVWNAGERIEGYTNFLMVALMTPIHWILPLRFAPLAVQILNLGFGIAVATQLCGLVEDSETPVEEREKVKTSALFLLLSYYPFLYWTLLGMEPVLITLFFLLIVRNGMKPEQTRTRRDDLRLAGFQILAWLCRPDSILFSVPLWLAVVYARQRKVDFRRAGLVLGLLVGAVALHTGVRKIYYGDWVPNTFYLKASGLTLSEKLHNGFLFLRPFFAQVIPLAGLAVAALVKGPGRRFAVPGLGLLAIVLGYQLSIGGDTFLDLWRFMVPAMPLLMLSASIFLTRFIAEKVSAEARTVTLAVAVVTTAVWLNATFLPWWTDLKETPGRKVTHQFIYIALALDDILKPGASVGVFSAGTIPYYLPHLRAIDFLGKSDRTIARSRPHLYPIKGLLTLPGHNKYDLKYSILQLKPTYVEHVRWFDDDVTLPAKTLYQYELHRGVGLILLRESPYVDLTRLRSSSK